MNLFTLAVSSIFFSSKFFTFCVNKHCSLGCQGGVLFHPRAAEARSCDDAAGTSVGMCKACVCVCVCEEDAVSSHQHTSLDTWDRGTLTLRLPSCSEGPPGLRTAHVPLREPRSWMTRKYLAVFLGILFLLRWCSEVERVLCTDICTLCYLENFHLYFALKKVHKS